MEPIEFSRELQLRHEKVLIENNPDDYLKIYDHWSNIPAVKSLTDVEQWIYDDKTIRLSIIRMMSSGYLSGDTEVYQTYNVGGIRRHCFHPREIQYVLNQIVDTELKLPNLYHHLDVLKEYKLITPVAVLSDGRYDLTYYGRTSRLFLFRTSNNEFDQVLKSVDVLITNLYQFCNILDLDYSKTEIETIISAFLDKRAEYENSILKLMEQKGDLMYQQEVDPSSLFILFTHIFTTSGLNKLRDDIYSKVS